MMNRRRFLKILGASTFIGILIGGFSYSYFIEPNEFTVTELDLDWGLGIKAVYISDTHIDSSNYDRDKLVSLIESIEPDIIFHTGDLINAPGGLDASNDLLLRLGEIAEVYVVLGNHDIWSGLTPRRLKTLVHASDNVYPLGNESVYHDGFWIVGVNDPYTYQSNLDKALEGVDSNPRLLLAHSPQIIGRAVDRVDFVLAGHTHGGQVRFPLIGPIWLPLPPKYRMYDYGLFQVSGTGMYVTRGVGTTFLPFRFNCPPEVVVISL